MHEFDEICYGKTAKELDAELKYQEDIGGLPSLITYIKDCIILLSLKNKTKVDWFYD